jgi:BMFP domain-containing protein YqiC
MEQWLQSHIYLGVLVLLILFFHTGGRFNDKIAVTTYVLVAIVVLSGVFGAILYATVPRMLTEVESNLTVDEISEQLNQLAKQMARISSGRSAPFQRICDQLLKESRPGIMAGWRLLISRKRRAQDKTTAGLANMLSMVPREEQDELRQMLVAGRQRRELLLRLIYQQRYKNMLEAWLFIHVPFTIALLVFAVLHIAAVFYYGRIRF